MLLDDVSEGFRSYRQWREKRGRRHEEGEYSLLTGGVVRTLALALKDQCVGVRETAAGILGKVGQPEGMIALDELVLAARDSEPNVKTLAVWALGRLGPEACPKGTKVLISGMRDSYWKVRTAACISVSNMGA